MHTVLAVGQVAPLGVFLAALAFVAALPRMPFHWRPGLLGAPVLALYVATAAAYLLLPEFLFDHVEPQIASVAFRAAEGAPIYHALEAAPRYALLYGPLAYLALVPSYALVGAGLLAAKIPGAAALALALLLLYATLERLRPTAEALAALSVVALALMGFGATGYWIRPDPLLMLAAAAPLPFIGKRPWRAAAALGIAIAVAAGLKAHGPIYLLPPLVLLWARHGWRPAGLALLVGAALTPLSFLHPTVSAADYIDWLRLAGRHGLGFGVLAADLQQAAILALPMALLLRRGGPTERAVLAYAAAIALTLVAVSFIAAKPLAGPRHLMPFLPLVAHACFELRLRAAWPAAGWRGRLAAAWILTLVFMAVGGQYQVLDEARRYAANRGAAAEIERILADRPGQGVEMGYSGRSYRLSHLRPLLVFAGNPYTLDAAALMDMQRSGLTLPAATLAHIEACATPLWLVPKGEPPFEMLNIYPPNPPLFDRAFVDAFRRRYAIEDSGDYYDVWGCR